MSEAITALELKKMWESCFSNKANEVEIKGEQGLLKGHVVLGGIAIESVKAKIDERENSIEIIDIIFDGGLSLQGVELAHFLRKNHLGVYHPHTFRV